VLNASVHFYRDTLGTELLYGGEGSSFSKKIDVSNLDQLFFGASTILTE
jgi:hypothetical protein